MHCSANIGPDSDVAVFFGLSGTGKTTLSPDPNRILIGDDEHGWSREGVFNFEGGCYAKAHQALARGRAGNLRHDRALRHRARKRRVRSADAHSRFRRAIEKTENTRIAYPLDFIPNASRTGRGGHPKNIVMLTCDAFGVLPPIAKLDAGAGHVSLPLRLHREGGGHREGRDGSARRRSRPASAHPFMPLHPSVYGNLLRELIAKHSVDCWLVNTGWTGGKDGVGRRMPIRVTRRLLTAALDGSLNRATFRTDPYFGFAVPTSVPGVEPHILEPVKTWTSKSEFAKTAKHLVEMFRKNFVEFESHVDAKVRDAAPTMRIAAE